MFEVVSGNFDYSTLDGATAEFLKERDQAMKDIAEDTFYRFGRELKKAQERLSNNRNGVFQKWYESKGFTKDNVHYCINLYLSSRNLDNKQKDNFLKAPKSLQVETMKKKTPEDVRQQVYDGEITTHKEFKESVSSKQPNRPSKDAVLNVYLDMMKNVRGSMERYSEEYAELEEDETINKFDDCSKELHELIVHLKTFLFASANLDESVKDDFELMLGTALKGEMSIKFSPVDWENLQEMRNDQVQLMTELLESEGI